MSPTIGGDVAGTEAPLAVRATDPEGDDLDVTFEGRAAGAGSADNAPFTMVAIPDLQNYTYSNRQGTISQQTNWIVNSRSDLNTAMVVQVGDLVSNADNATQWTYTSDGLKVLDDARVPNTVLPGNHDFDVSTGDYPLYNQFFPVSRYANANWTPSTARYGGYMGQNLFGPDSVNRDNMNNFALFAASGRDFLVLNLEWDPPRAAVEWAAKVLDAYPDRTAIVATHAFLDLSGERFPFAGRPGGTSAQALWTDLISKKCSIKLVVSGHAHDGDRSEASRTDANQCGQPVHQILTDYQSRPNGGDGWLRYYTFDPAAQTMTAKTYSPKLNRYETDADSQFTLPFTMPAPATGFQPIKTVQVDSGSVAQAPWSGLHPTGNYEWRVKVSDGQDTVVSPTWSFNTVRPRTALVTDEFERTSSSGWGATASGQTWQTNGTASLYSVANGAGRVNVGVGSTRSARVNSVSVRDVRTTVDLSTTPAATGSGVHVPLLARINGSDSYRAKLRFVSGGALNLSLVRFKGSETILTSYNVPGSFAAGQPLRLRFEAVGSSPTTLRAKVWPVTGSEPANWQVNATDSTAGLQIAGGLGLDVYNSGSSASAAQFSLHRYVAEDLSEAPANERPRAVISDPQITGRAIQVSGEQSSDPDGSISSYRWTFGDGGTASGRTASHTYADPGTYRIELQVTDDAGATDTTTREVTVAADANRPPVAVIATPQVTGTRLAFSGAGSSDPDGSVVSYDWDFGDESTGEGASVSHTYAAPGPYEVTLTVTDDDGATTTVERDITIEQSTGPKTVARDAFSRTTTDSWGSADLGGQWTTVGAGSRYRVSGGTGQQVITTKGTTAEGFLPSVAAQETELRSTVAWSRNASAGTVYGTFSARRQADGSAYRVNVVSFSSGATQLILIRKFGSVETALRTVTVNGLRMEANTRYEVAFSTTTVGSSTQLAAKMWPVGTTEPSAWTATTTDATAGLQRSGSAGVASYMSSSATSPITMSVDDLSVRDLAAG